MPLTRLDSPVGVLTVVSNDGRLVRIDFGDTRDSHAPPTTATPVDDDIVARLGAYFDGDLTAIDTIEVAVGGTAFQRNVWLMLRQIPAGQTWSYTQLASAVGTPTAVRAVGAANGANPIPLVLPCHRVIGRDGRLVGYGGGLERKQWLLAHEGVRTLRLWREEGHAMG